MLLYSLQWDVLKRQGKDNVYMQAITGADSPGISPTWGMKSRTFHWLFTGSIHFHTDDVYTFI